MNSLNAVISRVEQFFYSTIFNISIWKLGAVGCGPQEEFRACADIAIGDKNEELPPFHPEGPPSRIPGFDEHTQSYWLWSLIAAGMFLLLVLAGIYFYGGRAKKWYREKRLILTPVEIPPVAPPRHKRQSIPSAQWQL